MPPVARTYLTAEPEYRDFGRKLGRGITPQLRRIERQHQLAVQPDTRQFGRRLLGGIRGPLRTAGGLMAGAFAGRAILGGLAGVISAASDLGETVNKNNVVFRGNAKEMLRWSRNSATALGMSREMALRYAGTLGNLFVSMKLGTPVAAQMSRKMVELASDLASFNNVNPEEALEALRAGLVGEVEPLRRFGINLNDATLRQEALRLGLVKTTKNVLPPAIRAQAAYSLILQQSKTAQGDFARTSGGLANQQRILRARVDDLKASLGRGLLPITTSFVGFLNRKAIPAVGALGRIFGETVAGLGRRLGTLASDLNVSIDLTTLRERAAGWAKAIVGGFQTGLRTGDWSQLGGILGNVLKRVVGNGAKLLGKIDWPAVGRNAGRFLGQAIAAAVTGAGGLVATLLDAMGGVDWFTVGQKVGKQAGPFAVGFASTIVDSIVDAILAHPKEALLAALAVIPVGRAAKFLERFFGRLPIAGSLLRALAGVGAKVERPIFGIVGSIGRFFGRAIERAFPGIGDRIRSWALRWILGLDALYGRWRTSGRKAVRGLRDGLVGERGLITRGVAGLIRLATAPFRSALRWLLPRGRAFVRGFWQGLTGQLGLVRSGVAGLIRVALNPFRPAGRWLVARGRQVVSGLISGLNAMRSAAGRAAGAVVSAIGNGFGRLRNVAAGPFRAAAGLINRFLSGLDSVARGLGIRIPWRIPPFQSGGVVPRPGRPGVPFQGGGVVPGQGMGDKILAGLEPGEVVIPNRRRDRRRLFRDPAVRRRLAGTGLDLGGDEGILAIRLMQKGGRVMGPLIQRVQGFMRSVDPLPYRWGGVGPGAYDCSGLAGEIVNRLTGRPSFRRLFTTSSIGPGVVGLRRGRGTFTIGTTSSTGHMAANLAGYGAEARSTRSGIFVGNAARAVTSFARQFYLPQMGSMFVRAGGDPGLSLAALFKPFIDRLTRGLGGLGGGAIGRLLAALGSRIVGAARKRATGGLFQRGGIVGQVMDDGGWLAPRSATLAVNRTRRWEPVGVGAVGPVVHVDLRGAYILGSARQVAKELAPELRGQLRGAGYRDGRRAGV